jgi:hypothetical protein
MDNGRTNIAISTCCRRHQSLGYQSFGKGRIHESMGALDWVN